MTDRPILFSAPMIRALLDGRKTQTRRVLKPQPTDQPAPRCAPNNEPRHAAPYLDAYCGEQITPKNPRGMSCDWHWWQVDDRPGLCVTKTSAKPGDRLWVREAFQVSGIGWGKKPKDAFGGKVHYRATDNGEWKSYWGGWRPSIHMPRWASRLTLTVTDVRVQRVQEISEMDVYAEGAMSRPTGPRLGSDVTARDNAINAFRTLWNSIHGPDAWNRNDWVAAYTFTVEQRNIDQ